MPRTQRSVPLYFSQEPNHEPPIRVESAVFTTGVLDFPCSLFAPMHYAPGYAYPLIVWLHGSGADERQLQRIMPAVSMRNYVAVAPRGILVQSGNPQPSDSFAWPQSEAAILQAEQRVFDSIEMAQAKLHIHPRRVFVAGHGDGGTMALRLAMSHPNSFAGVISIGGPFPTGGTPFGNLVAARRLGMFFATARVSQTYPAEQVCEDLRLLHTAGLSITLRQYPGGCELGPQILADMNRWIMEQITPPPSPAVEAGAEWSREAD